MLSVIFGAVARQNSQRPITFEDLGINKPVTITQSCLGKLRTVGSVTRWEWCFISVALICICATIGLTAQRLVTLDPTTSDFTFGLILIINCALSIFYIVHGILFERPFEVLIVIGATFIVMLYCIIEYVEYEDRHTAIKLARLISVSVLAPILAVLGLIVFKQFYQSGNLIFKTVGANTDLQTMLWTMFLFEDLLKFDFQLEISMIVLILKDGAVLLSTMEYVVLFGGSAFALIWLVFGFILVRVESLVMVAVFSLTSLLEPAYVIYKMVLSSTAAVNNTNMSLTSFVFYGGIVALVLRIVVMGVFVAVVRNFGKGIREKAFGENPCCTVEAPEAAAPQPSTSQNEPSQNIERY